MNALSVYFGSRIRDDLSLPFSSRFQSELVVHQYLIPPMECHDVHDEKSCVLHARRIPSRPVPDRQRRHTGRGTLLKYSRKK